MGGLGIREVEVEGVEEGVEEGALESFGYVFRVGHWWVRPWMIASGRDDGTGY